MNLVEMRPHGRRVQREDKATNKGLDGISPLEARELIKVLADGVPPHDRWIQWLTVGHEALLAEFDADLDAVARGEFRSLLLLGHMGTGKSHLLTTLEFAAIERRFATAYFSQDVQSKQAFNRPDQIYRRIIETMRLPDDVRRTLHPLQTVLDRWVDCSLPKLEGTRRSMAIAYKLSELGLLPADTANIHPRVRVALVGYILATEQQNGDARREFLRALQGPGLTSGDLMKTAKNINLQRKAFIGYTPGDYDTRYYFGQLNVLVFILRVIGYCGMVILFDEVTAIVDLRRKQSRAKAYSVMDSLLFNDLSYAGLYTVFAYMPAFVTQLRADQELGEINFFKRWRKLWEERVREIPQLDETYRLELLQRLARLHGIAHGWQPWEKVAAAAGSLSKRHRAEDSNARALVRAGLHMLDEYYSLTRGDSPC